MPRDRDRTVGYLIHAFLPGQLVHREEAEENEEHKENQTIFHLQLQMRNSLILVFTETNLVGTSESEKNQDPIHPID